MGATSVYGLKKSLKRAKMLRTRHGFEARRMIPSLIPLFFFTYGLLVFHPSSGLAGRIYIFYPGGRIGAADCDRFVHGSGLRVAAIGM